MASLQGYTLRSYLPPRNLGYILLSSTTQQPKLSRYEVLINRLIPAVGSPKDQISAFILRGNKEPRSFCWEFTVAKRKHNLLRKFNGINYYSTMLLLPIALRIVPITLLSSCNIDCILAGSWH